METIIYITLGLLSISISIYSYRIIIKNTKKPTIEKENNQKELAVMLPMFSESLSNINLVYALPRVQAINESLKFINKVAKISNEISLSSTRYYKLEKEPEMILYDANTFKSLVFEVSASSKKIANYLELIGFAIYFQNEKNISYTKEIDLILDDLDEFVKDNEVDQEKINIILSKSIRIRQLNILRSSEVNTSNLEMKRSAKYRY